MRHARVLAGLKAGSVLACVSAATAMAPPALAQTPVDAGEVVPMMEIHVESERPVTLHGRPIGTAGRKRDDSTWTQLCDSPCDTAVPASWEYRLSGEGVGRSGTFTLHGQPGQRVVVTVDPASKAWFVFGIVGTSAGGGLVLVGLLSAFLEGAMCGDSEGSCSGMDGGLAVAGAGLVLLLGGLLALGANASTGVQQGGGAPGTRPEERWRAPVLREPAELERALPPSAVSLPIFGARF